MPIELKNIEPWRRVIGAISAFVTEGNFRFNNQGVFFRETDPSQIVLVDFFVAKRFFPKFSLEPAFVGIDIAEFNKILQRCQPNDVLRMDLKDLSLVVELEGDFRRSFQLQLIDLQHDEPSIPSTKFDSIVQINGRVLKECLKDAALFGSSVVFKVKDQVFSVESKGNRGLLQSVASQQSVVSVKSSADVVTKFNLNFLQNIVKEADSDKRITLELKSDAPMKVSYEIGEIQLQFYLAHMIL